jgi:hypothetical protein
MTRQTVYSTAWAWMLAGLVGLGLSGCAVYAPAPAYPVAYNYCGYYGYDCAYPYYYAPAVVIDGGWGWGGGGGGRYWGGDGGGGHWGGGGGGGPRGR